MKSWKIYGQSKFETVESDIERKIGEVKIKVTKVLVSPSDLSLFKGDKLSSSITPGRVAIGLISDADENSGYKIGEKVLVTPYAGCGVCSDCKSGRNSSCNFISVRGLDSDGFMSDYAVVSSSCIHEIPDGISEEDALLSEYLAIAVNVIEKLNVKKCDYVIVSGSSVMAYIISQLCIYYHAVPIMISSDSKSLEFARENGIYYTINSSDENTRERVLEITSGNLADRAVYDIDSAEAEINLCSHIKRGSQTAIVGFGGNSTQHSADLTSVVSSESVLIGVSSGAKDILSALNLIVNSAVNLSAIKKVNVGFSEIDAFFKKTSLPICRECAVIEIEK